MRDLKLLEASGIAKLKLDESDLSWPACKASLRLFKANAERTARMIEAPIYAAMMADIHRLALHRALGGEPTIEQMESGRKVTIEEMDSLMGRIIGSDGEVQKDMMIAHAHNLNEFIRKSGDVHLRFESLLNAILVDAWTTFEVLAQDIHKRVRSLHSECFPHLNGTETFTFLKREPLRASYSTAFRGDGGIKMAINEQCVDALSLVRNLIVHKAGVVDQIFKDRCKEKHLTKWASLPLDQRFEPDGDIVRRLIDPNMKCACRLIKTVDKWLTINKPKI